MSKSATLSWTCFFIHSRCNYLQEKSIFTSRILSSSLGSSFACPDASRESLQSTPSNALYISSSTMRGLSVAALSAGGGPGHVQTEQQRRGVNLNQSPRFTFKARRAGRAGRTASVRSEALARINRSLLLPLSLANSRSDLEGSPVPPKARAVS